MCFGRLAAAAVVTCTIILFLVGAAVAFAAGGYAVKALASGMYSGAIPPSKPFSDENFWTWDLEYAVYALSVYALFAAVLFSLVFVLMICDGLFKRFKKDYIYGPLQRRIADCLGCVLCPCCRRRPPKYRPLEAAESA